VTPNLPAVRSPERLTGEQLQFIASTAMVPPDYRGRVPEIMACIAAGRELGLGDMESLRMIKMIDGTPTMAAQVMLKRARTMGHSITYESDTTEMWVKAIGRRVDNGDTDFSLWNMKRAEVMGLLKPSRSGKPTSWDKQPMTMLKWRSTSELVRFLFPDVLGGGVIYTPDEAERGVDEIVGDFVRSKGVPETGEPDDSSFSGGDVGAAAGGGAVESDPLTAEAAPSAAGERCEECGEPGGGHLAVCPLYREEEPA
jgi:hypothetical protein